MELRVQGPNGQNRQAVLMALMLRRQEREDKGRQRWRGQRVVVNDGGVVVADNDGGVVVDNDGGVVAAPGNQPTTTNRWRCRAGSTL